VVKKVRNYDNLSRFYRIAERDEQTDGQTALLYQYRASSMLTHNRNGEAGFIEPPLS